MTRVAFVGSGNMAAAHARAFSDISYVDLVGVYSRTSQNAEKFKTLYRVKHTYSTIDELYHSARADIVVVAVSELSLESLCPSLFAYPWLILIEKPVGYNYEIASKILRLANKSGAKVYVALNRRNYSSTSALLNDLSENPLSRVVQVFDQEAPSRARSNGAPELVTKNWEYANSIHLVDFFSILCRGKLINVNNVVSTEHFVLSSITYSSGDVGVYSCHWDCPSPWAVSVTTKNQRWELRPIENLTYQKFGTREIFPIQIAEWDKDFKPGLRKQAEEIIKIFRGHNGFIPSVQEAFSTVDLINKIYGT